jgi:NADP-reducing hydrogenase subunit HndA
MSSINIKLKEQDFAKIKEISESFNNDPGELKNVLHECQEHFGYLPAEIQEVVASCLNMSVAKVFGVVSFYSFYTMTPKGEHPISLCTGTACYVRGADKILDELKKVTKLQVGETSADGKFSLSCLRCVGACGLAPVLMVGEKTYGRVAPGDVEKIINEYR